MTDPHPAGYPFGATRTQRVWRRLAGAAAAHIITLPLAFAMPLLLFVPPTYLLGLPLSWVAYRRTGPTTARTVIRRHTTYGAAAGFVMALVVAAWTAVYGGWVGADNTADLAAGWVFNIVFWSLFAVPAGCGAGAFGAWVATRLPARAVRPVAVTGVVITAGYATALWVASLLGA